MKLTNIHSLNSHQQHLAEKTTFSTFSNQLFNCFKSDKIKKKSPSVRVSKYK